MIIQQVIKAVNKKKIYMLISENPGISRVNLAARTELSKTTVSALVDELIQEGRWRASARGAGPTAWR